MLWQLRSVAGLCLIVGLTDSLRAQSGQTPTPAVRPSSTNEPATSDSTGRSAAASGISEFRESIGKPLNRTKSGWGDYIRGKETAAERAVRLPQGGAFPAISQAEKAARMNEMRQATQAIAQAERFAGKFYVKALGVGAGYADLVGTAGGYASVGDFSGTAVAVVDDVAEGMYAAGGAVLACAVAGSAFGPLGTVGGAVTGLAGAVVFSLGYNAFISPDVTSFAAEVFGEPQDEYYHNLAVETYLDHRLNSLSQVDEYLVEKLTEKLREQDALAATAANKPPDSILTAPPVDAQGRKRCPYCGEYH